MWASVSPVRVVDVGAQLHHGLPAVLERCRGGAEDDLRDVGEELERPRPRAEPRGRDGHVRDRSVAGAERGEDGGPRGRGELDGDVDTMDGRTPEQLDDGGRRIGQHPVGRPDHARARRHGAGADDVHAEHLQRGGDAHHVDDGVEHRRPRGSARVPATAGAGVLRHRPSGRTRPTIGPAPAAAGGPRRAVPGCGSTCARWPSPGSGPRRGWPRCRCAARAGPRPSTRAPAPGPRCRAPRRGRRRRRAARREPCRRRYRRSSGTTHGGAHWRIRATAHAAPKPLSMPTTHTPGAHDDSMARRAVTPSSDAP